VSYEVTLLVFGILLLLLGLVGNIKAKEIEVGTSSTTVRVVTSIVGLVLMILSFNPEIPGAFLSSFTDQDPEPAGIVDDSVDRMAEQARLAEEQRQADERARLEEEQRQADEQARLAEEQRQAGERARLEEERRQADERARLEEERRQADERARLEEERRSQLSGVYTIQQKSNGRYMDAHEGSRDNSVVTRDRQNNATQQWIIRPL